MEKRTSVFFFSRPGKTSPLGLRTHYRLRMSAGDQRSTGAATRVGSNPFSNRTFAVHGKGVGERVRVRESAGDV